MKDLLQQYLPGLHETQYEQLCLYYARVVEENERVNLTAITEPGDFVRKHFADSALGLRLLDGTGTEGKSLIDVGTGAGFPGLVLKILRPGLRLTLLDSLGKRVRFLEGLCAELGFADTACIHARAEDAGRDVRLRAQYDFATARAVAHAAFLAEWLAPFLKLGGRALLYKGPQGEAELGEAHNALAQLRCRGETVAFPEAEWGARSILLLTKEAPTPKAYPRRAGSKAHL